MTPILQLPFRPLRIAAVALCAVCAGLLPGQTSSTTSLTSQVNPAFAGYALPVTATVVPASATGTVTFKEGTAVVGTGTLSGGAVTVTLASLAYGPHALTATYGGDSSVGSSVSPNLIQVMYVAAYGPVDKWVPNVQYDVAGRMTSMQYELGPHSNTWTTEALGYNVNGQLTSLTWGGAGSPVAGGVQYIYDLAHDNGQITQAVDSISGETIVYQYDALKRLISAASTPTGGSSPATWNQQYQYDGFGNMTGRAPVGVNPLNNRLACDCYDLNGNMTSGLGANFTYDVANRMVTAVTTANPGNPEKYAYSPDNKRVYRQSASGGTPEYTFYGARGEKLGVYGAGGISRLNVWFAGKLIWENGTAVFQDRLGTNRAGGARFYPYGDEITSTANDREKFGTYTRDSYTGLDYADQRFYASAYGRFNTADPYKASAGPKDPGSWNRYSYVQGDPVNRNDPHGLYACDASGGAGEYDPTECEDFTFYVDALGYNYATDTSLLSRSVNNIAMG